MKTTTILLVIMMIVTLGQAQLIVTTSATPASCFGSCDGTISVSVSGGTPPYSYTWSPPIYTTSVITNVCPGTYIVTVTDAMGLTGTATDVVYAPTQLTAVINASTTLICPGSNAVITAGAFGGTSPYTYMWSTGSTDPTQVITMPGVYCLTVVDANACIGTTCVTIQYSTINVDLGPDQAVCNGTPFTITPQITGANPPYLYSWSTLATTSTITVQPAGTETYTITVTDANGCTGVDMVTLEGVDYCNTISGYVYSDLNQNGVKDPGENPIPNAMLQIQGTQRYGLSGSDGFYSILTDIGTFTVDTLPLLQGWTLTSALPVVSFTGSGETDSLNNVGFYLDMDTNLTVYFYTTPIRPGFPVNQIIGYRNNGTASVDAQIRFVPDPLFSPTSASPAWTSVSGDTLIWDIGLLNVNTNGNISLISTVPVSAVIGTVLTMTSMILPVQYDCVPADNVFVLYPAVTGSWDPNDKAVSPVGSITPDYIDQANWLRYTIRFQNTGNDTCFNAVVRDVLDDNLNMSSFRVMGTSHPYTITFDDREVSWHFNNILLPDSTTNEPESNGFIIYEILANPGTGLGETIENTAYIYFDFNPAVITNTVVTTVAETMGSDKVISSANLRLYPNPVQSSATLQMPAGINGKAYIRIFNAQGQIISQFETIAEEYLHLELNQSPGIYLMQVNYSNLSETLTFIVQ